MEPHPIFEEPTKKISDVISTPSLPVLSPEEKEQRYQTAKQGTSAIARLFLLIARSIRLNFDLIVMALLLFVFVTIGYTYARIQGMSASDIKIEITEIFELIGMIISGLGVVLVKLGMDRGAFSTTIGEKMQEFKTKVFRQSNELDTWGRTIVGDRAIDQGHETNGQRRE